MIHMALLASIAARAGRHKMDDERAVGIFVICALMGLGLILAGIVVWSVNSGILFPVGW